MYIYNRHRHASVEDALNAIMTFVDKLEHDASVMRSFLAKEAEQLPVAKVNTTCTLLCT